MVLALLAGVTLALGAAAQEKKPDAALAGKISAACHAQGVLTLTCGTYGNVLRFLPPLVMPDHLLDEALSILEEVTLGLV